MRIARLAPSPTLGVAIVALFVALGGTAGAVATKMPLGGPTPRRDTRAFALVDPNGGSPRLIQAQTQGFVAVNVGPFGPGDYCLTPAPRVDVVSRAAVASEEAFYSAVLGVPTVRYPTTGPACEPNQLEVKTFNENVQLSDQIAFTVTVG
jgi:hypothetical protein